MTNIQETSQNAICHIARLFVDFTEENKKTGNPFIPLGFGKEFWICHDKSKREKDDLSLIVSLDIFNNNRNVINHKEEGSLSFTVKFQFVGKDGAREYAGPNEYVSNVNSLMELCLKRL
jgi:hypothetical protein